MACLSDETDLNEEFHSYPSLSGQHEEETKSYSYPSRFAHRAMPGRENGRIPRRTELRTSSCQECQTISDDEHVLLRLETRDHETRENEDLPPQEAREDGLWTHGEGWIVMLGLVAIVGILVGWIWGLMVNIEG